MRSFARITKTRKDENAKIFWFVRQFTLRSAWFASLRASPLFLALVFVREELTRQMPSSMMFFNVMACAAVYGGIFAARTETLRLRSLDEPGRSVLPGIWRGALYGASFLSLAFGPAIFAQLLRNHAVLAQLTWLQRFRSPANLFELFRRLGGCIGEFALVLGFCAFLGFFLGAAGGAVAGSMIEIRKRRGRARLECAKCRSS